MARNPPAGPHVVNGILTQAVLDWIRDGQLTTDSNIGSINSGVAQAQASANAAQAAADGAQQAAQDVGANSLVFSIALNETSLAAIISGAGSAVTDNVTVTPTGGTAPYTYAWAKVSGDTLDVSAATSATTNFSKTLTNGQSLEAVYRITVTDNAALTRSLSIGVGLLSLLE